MANKEFKIQEGITLPVGTDITFPDGSVQTTAYVEPSGQSYKGFKANYGRMYDNTDDPNGPIDKLVIYQDSVSGSSTIDTTTDNDDFAVTGLLGSSVVAMIVAVSDNITATDLATLKTFAESIIDNVILDGGVEGQINSAASMRSAFYDNFSTFSAIMPDLKTNLEFFNTDTTFNINPTFVTGKGSEFYSISYNMTNDTLTLGGWSQNAGTHVNGDQFVIPGNTIQDTNGNYLATPDNDVTVIVTNVNNGMIDTYSVTGTLPRPAEIWPSNYIGDGGDDEYDEGNYINTNLENGISYNDGNVATGSSAVGGGDYVVTYQASIFGFFAVNANINSISTSGGSGFDGDGVGDTGSLYGDTNTVNIGDITFDGSRINSPAPTTGDFPLGVITLAPGNANQNAFATYGQFINIYPTTNYDEPHIHIDAGEGYQSKGDLMLGPDGWHIDINHNGNIYIKTSSQAYSWTFDSGGNLTLPNGGDIRDSSGTSVLGGGGTQGIQGIQGADGLQGLQGGEGLQGLPGMDGAPGSPGMDGSPGSPGMDGLQGLQGGEGVQGVQGLQGADGVQGAAGNIISISSEPPSSPTSGQVYYDSDDGNIYIYTGSAWVDSSPSGGGTTLPANANGYLNNDGTGTLTWVAGNPAGSGSLPYSDVWVLSTKTDAFWTSYMLNGTIAPLFNFGQYPLTLTASNQPAYGKQMVSGQKICVVNDAAIHSSVNYYGLVFEFPSSPAVGDTWIPWHNTQSQTVNAGSFIVGKTYSISSPGNTTWTSIGSVGNEVNRTFIATGAGSGSGTAKTTVGVDRLILLPASGQKVLTMNISGTTSFGQGTATVATYLDILNNSNPICFIYAGVLNGTPTWIHSYF